MYKLTRKDGDRYELINNDPGRRTTNPDSGGGATSLETLARITVLEQELADLKQSVASDTAYGLAKVTNAADVTQESGIALSAVQNNAAVDGTLANEIKKINNAINESGVTGIRYLGVVRQHDSELDTIAQRKNVNQYQLYALVQNPEVGGEYVQGGGTHVVLGMQYGGNKYGTQISIGPYIKHRFLQDGAWSDWMIA